MTYNTIFRIVIITITFSLIGCTTTIDFDQLPAGLTPNTGIISEGDSLNPNSIVSDQYANKGVTFSSSGSGVFLLSGASAPSQPNLVCPTQANDRAGFSEPTEIIVDRSEINSACDAWLTFTATSGRVTVTSFDSSGNQIASVTTAQNTGNAPVRVHLDGCGTKRIRIETAAPNQTYCFDDLRIRTNF